MAEISEQAAKVLAAMAGAATTWGLELGLRTGVLGEIARRGGASAEEVAAALDLDPLYTKVLLRGAYSAEVLDLDDDRYRLGEHMGTLLLDPDSPAYLSGAIKTMVALRETFLDLRGFAATGQREWWGDFDPEWIDAVGENGQTYYRRILNVVVPQLPAVQEKLEAGARYLDLACGLCRGPAKVAEAFPQTRITAVDCDAYSLDQAEREMKERGIGDRFTFLRSFLENLDLEGGHDLAIINISLHEARDIARAVERAYAALDPGGVFLVSEFPFPEREEDTRTIPGRLMSGVQFFEAHIGCQLLPTSRFLELLGGAGFQDIGTIDVTPTHVVVHGTK